MKDIIMLADENGQNRLYQIEDFEIVEQAFATVADRTNDNLRVIVCSPFDALKTGSKSHYLVKVKPL